MVIYFLLESTELSGGVRVVFDHARLLIQKGHQVFIRARFGDHQWYHHDITIEYVDDLAAPVAIDAVSPDVVIATFWTTVAAATRMNCQQVFHFCQGFEGDLPEYAGIREHIDQAYRAPIPKLTVGNWLTSRLQDIYADSGFAVYTIGQIVDTALFNPSRFLFGSFFRRLSHRPVKILLMGLFESSVKGIPDALYALDMIRKQAYRIHVTRISSHEISETEKQITPISQYLTKQPPETIAHLYRTHDLMIAPSHAQEGFGLPFAEALASGLPCIATAIPSHLSFDEKHDYAVFVPPNNPEAIAQAIIKLLGNPPQQSYLRKRGPQLMQQLFASNSATERLEQICLNSLNR